MKKGCVFVLGLVLGGAIGWIAGVLSAPRSGQETMSALSSKAIELSSIMGFYGNPSEPAEEAEVVVPGETTATEAHVDEPVPAASEEA
jgi:hypothetical protein